MYHTTHIYNIKSNEHSFPEWLQCPESRGDAFSRSTDIIHVLKNCQPVRHNYY